MPDDGSPCGATRIDAAGAGHHRLGQPRNQAATFKRRIDAAARGETRTVSISDANRVLRERQRARRSAAR